MRFKEYGAGNAQTVVLLHGGGLSWWNYREAAELLQARCRVLLPILDGHAGSDRPFTTIEDNAAALIAFLEEHPAELIGGLSLGAQVLLEALSQKKKLCRAALVESASVLPSPLTRALIAPSFGGSYGLIKNRRFAELQFRSLHMKPELFEDYYRDSCAIRKEDLIAFMEASTGYALKPSLSDCGVKLHVFAGEKETRGVLRSAALLRERVPGSTLEILPGLYHGAFSINRAPDYAQTVLRILEER